MPNPSSAKDTPPPHRAYDPLAGLLSYLVPGLGQIYQGRIVKGVVFMVSLYALFFYGMALGKWSNVYLPDTADKSNPYNLPRPLANVYNRLQFAGQFWIGVAAWPAVWQYVTYDPKAESGALLGNFQRTPSEDVQNAHQRDGDKRWDLGWVYTVIAGVLNILVIYDAFAGPAFRAEEKRSAKPEAVT